MMKKILYIILSATVALAALSSCGSDEGDLSVSYHDPNSFFEPAPNATDEISVLRRQFYQKYGAYILFNDTLQKKFSGVDVLGDSIFWVEKLELDYTIGQVAYASNNYSYDLLLSVEDQKAAIEYMEDQILVHLGGKLMPYSWLMIKQINAYNTVTGTYAHPYCATGQRAIAIATGQISRLKTEAQKQAYFNKIMSALMPKLCKDNKSAFAEFLAVSDGYYGRTISASSNAEAAKIARSHGFLDFITNSWGATATPALDNDFEQFCSYMYNHDDAYMETTFAEYPLVLQKWYLFKHILASLGYKF